MGTSANMPIMDGSRDSVRLWMKSLHEKLGHAGVERTVAEVRSKLHVLQLRTAARKVVLGCLLCRQRRAEATQPQMGQLPPVRLASYQPPFSQCGLDFFGPMMVTIGRRREKRYGALFTCLTTRAVHLEVADSLSADSAIMAFRRMTSRRGTPQRMVSDNGTNFHAAAKELRQAAKEVLEDDRWNKEMTRTRTEWSFIPPGSPHMGGAWERLVKSVKAALTHVLKEKAPRVETLLTAMAEVEYTINSRPLTHIAVEPDEEVPLTPNHFLLGGGCRPMLAHYGPGTEDVCLRKQWRVAQQLADHFWRRWVREYMPTLTLRDKWHDKTAALAVGDVVVIVDPALPRNSWPKARVQEVHPGRDGQVRAVTITTASGSSLRRPATKLIKLPMEPHAEC
jgi:transposase InsO family protein